MPAALLWYDSSVTGNPPCRWYLSRGGRVLRALIGLPILALAVWLFSRGSAWAIAAGVVVTLWALSLPAAAIVQEPD